MPYESSSTALVPMFQDVVYKVISFVTTAVTWDWRWNNRRQFERRQCPGVA